MSKLTKQILMEIPWFILSLGALVVAIISIQAGSTVASVWCIATFIWGFNLGMSVSRIIWVLMGTR